MTDLFRTPLFQSHVDAGGKMVDFGGWEMPIHYGSQVKEHKAVRDHAGVFDVSHMTVIDLTGSECTAFLHRILANNVDRLDQVGRALYTGMLNESGGVIDDLICYRMDTGYRLVVNCATREKDLIWMNNQAKGFDVSLNEQSDLAMLAIQGPQARQITGELVSTAQKDVIDAIKPFNGQFADNWFIARTGYTGEDGLEIMLSASEAISLWKRLLDAGVAPAGLGARDTLRLEAGMNLYGNDMDDSVTPLVSAMGWTVAWEPDSRKFIGREALEKQKSEGVQYRLAGIILEGKGIMRSHASVIFPDTELTGQVTSGTFSPTLGISIGMARIPTGQGTNCEVELRGRKVPARIVKMPFVRNGKKVFE